MGAYKEESAMQYGDNKTDMLDGIGADPPPKLHISARY
jgi:hypothetical protein